jgi:hypothetical protein
LKSISRTEFERLVKIYGAPYTDEELQEIVEARTDQNQKDADLLKITRSLLSMWAFAYSKNYAELQIALKKKIEESAQFEWGPETQVVFDFEGKTVLVENFDGRSTLIQFSELTATQPPISTALARVYEFKAEPKEKLNSDDLNAREF